MIWISGKEMVMELIFFTPEAVAVVVARINLSRINLTP